jgi:hypothetical protein
MIRFRGILFCIILSLASAGLYFLLKPTENLEKNEYDLYAQLQQHDFREGYLIFVTKPGVWGDIAQGFSGRDSRYGHIGIIAKSQDGAWTVINAAGDPMDPEGSIREENLKNFMASATKVGIFELKLDADQTKKLIDRARFYVDAKYKFNSQFILGQTNAFYCTELIWVLIKEVTSNDIVPKKRVHWGYEYIGIDDLTINPWTKELLQIDLN